MKGKHVSRSVYQKVVEENKKLKNDLKTICYYPDTDDGFIKSVECMDKWYDYFQEQKEQNEFFRELAREYLKKHPELDIRNWKKNDNDAIR